MTANALLILYGDSVFLAGLKVALGQCGMLDIITVEAGRHGVSACVQELTPCAVLYERAAALPDFALALLYDRPDLLLIGVDACSDEITILSLHKQHVSSVTKLVDVIRQYGSPPRPVTGLD